MEKKSLSEGHCWYLRKKHQKWEAGAHVCTPIE
jgi:hypothetical protein